MDEKKRDEDDQQDTGANEGAMPLGGADEAPEKPEPAKGEAKGDLNVQA